jgi:signal transduction histidine kinase
MWPGVNTSHSHYCKPTKGKLMIDEAWIKERREVKHTLPADHLHELGPSPKDQHAALIIQTNEIQRLERKRIALDLHDEVGGNLSALKMLLSHVWKKLPDTPYLTEQYLYLDQLVDTCIESIHKISLNLLPDVLEAGLPSALTFLATEFTHQTAIPCKFHCNLNSVNVDKTVAILLFRIAQEALTNVRKHAQASAVEIHLYGSDSELQLEIIDNGCGIPEHQRYSSQSFGLQSMRERSAEFGGRLLIATSAGKGTLLSVRVPYFSCVTS